MRLLRQTSWYCATRAGTATLIFLKLLANILCAAFVAWSLVSLCYGNAPWQIKVTTIVLTWFLEIELDVTTPFRLAISETITSLRSISCLVHDVLRLLRSIWICYRAQKRASSPIPDPPLSTATTSEDYADL